MNCLQHVIFIYILVSSNWYQFRTGHSWSTPDGLNQTSCGTAGKLTHDMIRRRISERIVTPYPAISRHMSVSIHTHLQPPPPPLNFLRPTLFRGGSNEIPQNFSHLPPLGAIF